MRAQPEGGAHKYQEVFPYKAMRQPICSLEAMTRLTVNTTQQSVQGIYCAVSVVLALRLWVLIMYCRQNLSSFRFPCYKLFSSEPQCTLLYLWHTFLRDIQLLTLTDEVVIHYKQI